MLVRLLLLGLLGLLLLPLLSCLPDPLRLVHKNMLCVLIDPLCDSCCIITLTAPRVGELCPEVLDILV